MNSIQHTYIVHLVNADYSLSEWWAVRLTFLCTMATTFFNMKRTDKRKNIFWFGPRTSRLAFHSYFTFNFYLLSLRIVSSIFILGNGFIYFLSNSFFLSLFINLHHHFIRKLVSLHLVKDKFKVILLNYDTTYLNLQLQYSCLS